MEFECMDVSMENILKIARNLKNYHYKVVGYPGMYGAEKLIDDFCGGRIFQFGKYKGQTISSIITYDTQYVRWCVANMPGFSLNENEQALLEAFNEGHVIHGDRLVMDGDGVYTEPADNDDVDYELLKWCFENY